MKFTLIALALVALLATVLACVWLRNWMRAQNTSHQETCSPGRHKGLRRTWRSARRYVPGTLTSAMAGLIEVLTLPVRRWRWRGKPELCFANIAEGTHEGNVTKLAAAAIATRFLIMKTGADAAHAVICTAATDQPMGICTDEADAAEDPINVAILGAGASTLKVTLGGTVVKDDLLVADSAGKAVKLSTTAGAYWSIGVALQGGDSGDVIEFDPQPRKVIVSAVWNVTTANGAIAALTFTGGGATGPEVEALRDKVEIINDDLIALKAVLNAAGITKNS